MRLTIRFYPGLGHRHDRPPGLLMTRGRDQFLASDHVVWLGTVKEIDHATTWIHC